MEQFLADPKYVEALKRIVQKEKELRKKYPNNPSWWDWEISDIGIEPWIVMKLLNAGIVKRTYSSNRHRFYRLVDLEKVEKMLKGELTISDSTPDVKTRCKPVPDSPEKLFEKVVGHEEYKWVVWKALKKWEKGSDPAHFLLVGPPASGKTMFLEEIEEKIGCVEYVAGEASRRGGFTDRILTGYHTFGIKYILLIDEIDKMDAEALKTIYNLMQGRLVISVSGKQVKDKVKIMVLATSNRLSKIPEALLSRFGKPLRFEKYNYDEFVQVVVKVLKDTEKLNQEISEKIAKILADRGVRDPRVAIQVARIVESPQDVEKAVKIILG